MADGTTAGPVVVATGFNREAACLAGVPGIVTVVGGGDPVALRRRIEEAAVGASGIASFGMTGALVDGLAIGDWVIGDRLTGATERRCDPAWSAALAATLPAARIGGFYADGRMICSVAEKLGLGRTHDALAVDMESHVASAVAEASNLPFVIVRCVSDGARHLLPDAIARSMRPDGGVDLPAMLASLARKPGQAGDVARTTAGFVKALAALRRGAQAMGSRLAFPT